MSRVAFLTVAAGLCALRASAQSLTDVPGAAAERGTAPVEVVVQGDRPAPGATSVTREQARALPGSFGDPLRALEAEPGVVPIVSGLPYFFIRGAPPANVGFFIDGIDVPLLYHAFFGPSVIHPGLIERVDLSFGAAPVEQGRFAGPIVSAKTRAPRYELNAEASVRAIDAGALVEAPFGPSDGNGPRSARGSAIVGGRYSYTGLVLSLLSDTKLSYWDYQSLINYRLSARDRLRLFAFGAYDFFDAGSSGVEKVGGETQFHRIDLAYDHDVSARAHVRAAATLGFDRTGDQDSVVQGRSARGRLEFERRVAERNALRAGVDVRSDDFSLRADTRRGGYADFSALFPARREFTAGAYAAFVWSPTPRMSLVPGVRADVYQSLGVTKLGVDPRLAASYRLTPRLSVEHSFGISHQPPNFIPAIPGAQVADLRGGLQEAWVWSSGARVDVGADVRAEASVFRAGYFHALDPIGGAREFTVDQDVLNQRATISALGLELKLSRSLTRRLGGFIGYTLSRTRETHASWSSVSGYDRPHVLQAAVAYDFGSGVRAALRAVAYSGIPARLIGSGRAQFDGGRRGPAYFRLDARVEKRFRLGESGFFSVVGEVLNATSSAETLRLDCGNVCQRSGPGAVVLPSIGVEAQL